MIVRANILFSIMCLVISDIFFILAVSRSYTPDPLDQLVNNHKLMILAMILIRYSPYRIPSRIIVFSSIIIMYPLEVIYNIANNAGNHMEILDSNLC